MIGQYTKQKTPAHVSQFPFYWGVALPLHHVRRIKRFTPTRRSFPYTHGSTDGGARQNKRGTRAHHKTEKPPSVRPPKAEPLPSGCIMPPMYVPPNNYTDAIQPPAASNNIAAFGTRDPARVHGPNPPAEINATDLGKLSLPHTKQREKEQATPSSSFASPSQWFAPQQCDIKKQQMLSKNQTRPTQSGTAATSNINTHKTRSIEKNVAMPCV